MTGESLLLGGLVPGTGASLLTHGLVGDALSGADAPDVDVLMRVWAGRATGRVQESQQAGGQVDAARAAAQVGDPGRHQSNVDAIRAGARVQGRLP